METPESKVSVPSNIDKNKEDLATELFHTTIKGLTYTLIDPKKVAENMTPAQVAEMTASVSGVEHVLENILMVSAQVVAQEIHKKFGEEIEIDEHTSTEDQFSLGGQRLKCLLHFSTNLTTEKLRKILEQIRPTFHGLEIDLDAASPYDPSENTTIKVLFKREPVLTYNLHHQ